MKKQLLALAVAGAFVAPTQADTVGFEVGVSYWDASIGGSDDNFGYAKDFDDASNTRLYGLLEHPVPVLPNVLVAINSIENDEQDGDDSLDTSFNDFLLYYEVLDNVVELDLGIGARQFTGEITDKGAGKTYDLDPTMPVLYGKAQFNLPITGLSFGVNVLTGTSGDDKSTDTAAFVRWESPIGLGLEGGYRALNSEFEVKKVDTELTPEFDGAFASVFFHF